MKKMNKGDGGKVRLITRKSVLKQKNDEEKCRTEQQIGAEKGPATNGTKEFFWLNNGTKELIAAESTKAESTTIIHDNH